MEHSLHAPCYKASHSWSMMKPSKKNMEFSVHVLVSSSFVVFFMSIMCCYFMFFKNKKLQFSNCKFVIFKNLPFIVQNKNHAVEVLNDLFDSFGDTFLVKDAIFTSINRVVTCNPHNIDYIFKTNFSNFPKGPDQLEIIGDIFGEAIFTTDSDREQWPLRRKMFHNWMSSKEFKSYLADMTKWEVECALVPLFTHLAKEGLVVDLQDVFLRYSYDISFNMVFGVNPKLLCSSFPANEFGDAMDVVMEAMVHRLIVPTTFWKLVRWLKVGWEWKNSKAYKTINLILEHMISSSKENVVKGNADNTLISAYMKSQLQGGDYDENEKALRDFAFISIFASSDTTSSGLTWFFWLVSRNPMVEAKILDELNQLVCHDEKSNTSNVKLFDQDQLKNSVYLHAALNEALRLYPPAFFNIRVAKKADVLPDGTRLAPGTNILLSTYIPGRTKSFWGDDCMDFRPERWINEDGKKLRPEIMSKLFTFGIGPRTCLGKDMAFNSMKMVAANILFNFDIQVVECNPESFKQSMVLFMKNGLKVKITKKTKTH